MCGICVVVSGFSVKALSLHFNPFEKMVENEFANSRNIVVPDFLHSILSSGRLVPDFTLADIYDTILPRGPDYIGFCEAELGMKRGRKIGFRDNVFGESDLRVLGVSSILHMRGPTLTKQPFTMEGSNDFLLYTGEIYNTPHNYSHSDTEFLFMTLSQICKFADKEKYLKSFLTSLHGDYSFVFFNSINNELVIGKDFFGKRSLLLGLHENGIVFSSNSILPLVPSKHNQGKPITSEIIHIPHENKGNENEELDEKIIDKYYREYLSSLDKTWLELPANSVYILNLDSFIFSSFEIVNREKIISIERPLSVVMITIKCLFFESLRKVCWNIPEIQRLRCKDKFSKSQLDSKTRNFDSAHIAIMFSGGIDSALIALGVSIVLPLECQLLLKFHLRIDLLNVSFDKEKSHDRKLAIAATAELRRLQPSRIFNCVLIDKDIEELKVDNDLLVSCIYPKLTHMDFNIGSALHYASKGQGYLQNGTSSKAFKSTAKVVLSGLGADEIFGGYLRYWVSYQRGGESELRAEMDFGIIELTKTNGKEIRFPFLDTSLVKFVSQLPLEYLVNFKGIKGTGDKILIRRLAFDLGLTEACGYKKKAIQFGTGIASKLNKLIFGGNRKAKGNVDFAFE